MCELTSTDNHTQRLTMFLSCFFVIFFSFLLLVICMRLVIPQPRHGHEANLLNYLRLELVLALLLPTGIDSQSLSLHW